MLQGEQGELYALNDVRSGRQRCFPYSLLTLDEPESVAKHLAARP
jgi:hypothetical protein